LAHSAITTILTLISGEDNAWHPFQPELYAGVGRLGQWGYRQLQGSILVGGINCAWAAMHFDLSQFPVKHREKVKLSVSVVLILPRSLFPADCVPASGVRRLAAALAGLPFWMSTFTLVHHTKQNIPFHAADQWQEVSAQLSGTFTDYPRWVEVLATISMFTSTHTTALSSYNLRLAHRPAQTWGLIFTIKVGSLGL